MVLSAAAVLIGKAVSRMATKYATRENGSLRVSHECDGESRTEQSHRDEVNINSIMRRYQATRLVPQRPGGARYGDFSAVSDYHSALSAIRAADEAFMTLPAAMRLRFENDPQKLVEFLSEARNREEAMELGLLEIEPPVESEMPSEGREPEVDALVSE